MGAGERVDEQQRHAIDGARDQAAVGRVPAVPVLEAADDRRERDRRAVRPVGAARSPDQDTGDRAGDRGYHAGEHDLRRALAVPKRHGVIHVCAPPSGTLPRSVSPALTISRIRPPSPGISTASDRGLSDPQSVDFTSAAPIRSPTAVSGPSGCVRADIASAVPLPLRAPRPVAISVHRDGDHGERAEEYGQLADLPAARPGAGGRPSRAPSRSTRAVATSTARSPLTSWSV